MTEVWTGRLSQFSSVATGFTTVEEMRSWCEVESAKNPDVFRHLLHPIVHGEVVRFHCPFGNLVWRDLSQLDSAADKKALRWDYHQWRSLVLAELESQDGPKASYLFDPANIKLFAATNRQGEQSWGLVWGMNIDNAKENFLPPYASREGASKGMSSEFQSEPTSTGHEVLAEDSFPRRKENEELQPTRMDDVHGYRVGMKAWFLRNRTFLNIVAFGTLILGLLKQMIWP